MRKLLPLILLFSAVAFGQSTVTVTANLKTIFAANQATKAKACFTLVDASTGQAVADPHVTGTGVLVATDNICIAPDANGLISTTMYANSAIVVQGAADTTYWSVQYLFNGSPTHGALYHFAGAEISEDLTTKSPATLTPSVTPTPTDGTYMRVDAGNSPATGTWQFPGLVDTGTISVTGLATLSGNATVGGTLDVTGATTAPSLNLAGTGVLSTTAQSGTGSLCMTTSCTMVTPALGAATGTSIALGGGTALTGTNQTGTGKLVLDTAPSFTNSTQDVINQKAATTFILKDNTGGTRFSIPSGGVAASTLNNTDITGGSTLSGTIPYNRLKANRGTALVTGDVSAITNFGGTASVSAVAGTDSAGTINIASAGAGQVANGTFTLTFHDGTWTTAPVCVANRGDGNGPNSAPVATSTNATTVTFIFNGTAVAGTTYAFNFICVGK